MLKGPTSHSSRPAPAEPSLSVRRGDGTPPSSVRITISGELDIVTAPALARELTSIIDGGSRRVIVDLRAVGFCDVAGLNLLVVAYERLHGLGGLMTLIGPNPAVQILLDVLEPGVALRLEAVPKRRSSD
jgi:anti-sigma B factor antagonist